jgi:3',5'-cyclic AMP phosphodiesterase CpdA
MKLYAISDLHVGYRENRAAVERLPVRPDDWLILAGDIADTVDQLDWALRVLRRKFARLLWAPGNHELWSVPRTTARRGVARYEQLVELCRRHGVITPEDPYPIWPGEGGPHVLAPLLLLYDYSFRPDTVPIEEAVAWARRARVLCSDELLLKTDPHDDVGAWCRERCETSAKRLEAALDGHALPSVLIAHFPLKRELARLPRIPHFLVWCGTRLTEDWHARFRASIVVSGHLHIPSTRWIDGVRFEEVSLGYPPEWRARRVRRGWALEHHLRQILPRPERDAGDPLRGWALDLD